MCVCSYLWLSVCDHFPEATAARRIPECRKLLCDDYQVAHVFATFFTLLLLRFFFTFSYLACSIMSDSVRIILPTHPLSSPPPCFIFLFLPYQFYSKLFFFTPILSHHRNARCCSLQNQWHLSQLNLHKTLEEWRACKEDRKDEEVNEGIIKNRQNRMRGND